MAGDRRTGWLPEVIGMSRFAGKSDWKLVLRLTTGSASAAVLDCYVMPVLDTLEVCDTHYFKMNRRDLDSVSSRRSLGILLGFHQVLLIRTEE